MTSLQPIDHDAIAAAVATLRAGQLVAFPTETVYGLGADARNEAAVRRVFAAKGRPADHPLIVHLPSSAMLPQWARDVPRAALALAARFWPGPLTLILPRGPLVPDVVTGGQNSVGLRVPDHPVAQALLHAFGSGIAAPSANRFGRISPTRAEHVRAEFGADVALVLDGGPSRVGLESSIVDLSGSRPALLRLGQITASQISAVIGQPIAMPHRSTTRAPGTLASHYAPTTPVDLVRADQLTAHIAALRSDHKRVAVLARSADRVHDRNVIWRIAPPDTDGYAQQLYANLRDLDAMSCDRIVVERVPDGEAWSAIRDRLQRAAHR